MKHFYKAILILLCFSCDKPNESKDIKIFNEFSVGLVEAWSKSISTHPVPKIINQVGDTIIIERDIKLVKRSSDTLDCPECYAELKAETELLITKIDEHIIHLKVTDINNDKITGYLFKDDFLDAIYPYIDFQRRDLLNDFNKRREELKFEIMKKHHISEEEFYSKVAEKYRQKTGNRGFSF
ncbi:hypothetical protein OO013_19985 [Mangrovivirga sp. M17]|uniref:Uncharacterized protein n=1 Tax=Mangrovivirga halotolerans TaxID=2993936 RepID=A0ABT3RXR3_9BACT|nr:hypothetical protein [Mangrovivirga halotolerans]MCX2746169.1 hypothetical protein [Mangrovivirga halotolerans]